jgi:hypothetical protein
VECPLRQRKGKPYLYAIKGLGEYLPTKQITLKYRNNGGLSSNQLPPIISIHPNIGETTSYSFTYIISVPLRFHYLLPHYYTHIFKNRYFLNCSFKGGIVNFAGSCQVLGAFDCSNPVCRSIYDHVWRPQFIKQGYSVPPQNSFSFRIVQIPYECFIDLLSLSSSVNLTQDKGHKQYFGRKFFHFFGFDPGGMVND